MRSSLRSGARLFAAGAGAAVGVYAAIAALAWHRYGRAAPPDKHDHDEWLDRFMPVYDVVERHRTFVAAPPDITLLAAREQDLLQLPLVRAIFKTRELVMRATPDNGSSPPGLLAATRALGWGVLAEVPDREIVVGAVTKPWEANVTFHALPPDEFAAFAQPGFVKIVWTLRADPVARDASIFRTETRAVATDAVARSHFRRYWAFTSPGITLIRRLSLGPLKREAERRAKTSACGAAMDGACPNSSMARVTPRRTNDRQFATPLRRSVCGTRAAPARHASDSSPAGSATRAPDRA